jgi:hypothetical protein
MDAADGGVAAVRKRPKVIEGDSELAFWAWEILQTRETKDTLSRREAWFRERILDLLGEKKTARVPRLEISLVEQIVETYQVEGGTRLRLEIKRVK